MTKAEFVSKLEEMKRRGRKLLIIAVVIFLAINGTGIYLLAAGPRNRNGFLIYALVLMGVWAAAALAILYRIRREVAVYSPKCPGCGKPITWREQASVMVNSTCPFCKAKVIDDGGA